MYGSNFIHKSVLLWELCTFQNKASSTQGTLTANNYGNQIYNIGRVS